MNYRVEAFATALVLAAAWVAPASAGRTDSSPVAFFYFGSEGTVSGSLGSTRNAFNGLDYLRCETHFGDESENTNVIDHYFGSCDAQSGLFQDSCTFPELAQPGYQQVLTTITPDSYLSLSWDTSSHECDSLYVYADSYDEPKLP